MHKSQISDDFVYWFRNGEDIFEAVFKEKFTQNVCLILESAIYIKKHQTKMDASGAPPPSSVGLKRPDIKY